MSMRFVTVAASLLPFVVAPAFAQCSMCRTVAAQANSIDKAIIILFLPAILLFSGVFVLAFRSQAATGEDGGDDRSRERNEREIDS
jgi:hypothetical protein